jgi:transcriptional regulator of heat shock response
MGKVESGVMESRQLDILRAIVEEYVATEEPVGSKAIAQRHGLGISPATIRNEMALLEDAGFITQPHTSAGRIPTDRGYRLFVDKLATVKPLSNPERRAIETFLDGADNLDDLMLRTVRLLSQLTRQVAVIQYPTETAQPVEKSKIAVAGTAQLVRTSHENLTEIEPILEALEEQVVLLKLLNEAGDSVKVRIGDEQNDLHLKSASTISMSYGSSEYGSGAVGVIGKKRMDYSNSMSAVSAVARYVSRFLGEK